MGMDVYGRNPVSPAGEYFRATIWSWRPIYSLIIELCLDLLDEEILRNMAYNDGAGPDDGQTCSQMADRFAGWLKENRNGHQVYVEREGSFEGGVMTALEKAGWATVNDFESSFTTSPDHLTRWVVFLRHCGGFEVW